MRMTDYKTGDRMTVGLRSGKVEKSDDGKGCDKCMLHSLCKIFDVSSELELPISMLKCNDYDRSDNTDVFLKEDKAPADEAAIGDVLVLGDEALRVTVTEWTGECDYERCEDCVFNDTCNDYNLNHYDWVPVADYVGSCQKYCRLDKKNIYFKKI